MLDKNKTENTLKKILDDDLGGCSYSEIEWVNDGPEFECYDDTFCRFSADNLSDDSLRALLDNFNIYISYPHEQPPAEEAEEGVTYFQVEVTEKRTQEEMDERKEMRKIRIQKQMEDLEKNVDKNNFYLSSEDINYVQTALFSFRNHFAGMDMEEDAEKVGEIMTRIGTLSKFLDSSSEHRTS